MDPDSYARLTQIVVDVMALNESAREAALVEACGGDEELLVEARRMLGHMGPESGMFSDGEIARRRESLDAVMDAAEDLPGSGPGGALEDAASEWLPERIGPYEIVRVIGRGGTGVVFEARQARPARSVAIKLLHPALASEGTVARLMREAEVLGRLQHPGIAQIFEAGEFDVGSGLQPYIVMQLVDGMSLVDFVKANDLSPDAKVDALIAVIDAVAHAHEHGITHRDLKPDNILVRTSDGQPILLDFGIASMATEDGLGEMTADGQLLGTIAYMAPEQARRSIGDISPATDVFALGAIAYEVVLGTRMRNVAGLSITQALTEIAADDAPKIRLAAHGYGRDLGVIVGKAVETRPRDRYLSAAELSADLRRYRNHKPIAARPPSALDRSLKFTRRHRALVAGLVATAVVLLAGIAATARQATIAERHRDQAEQQLYAAEMRLATSVLHDPARCSRLDTVLDRWRPPAGATPGWEWSLVDSVSPRESVRVSLDDSPFGLAWEPDGRRLAVATTAGVQILDSGSGEVLDRLDRPGQQPLLLGVSWSDLYPERVFVHGVSVLLAWDLGSDEALWEREIRFTSGLDFTHDGHLFYVDDKHLYVVDANDGSIVRERAANVYTDGSGAVSPDGRTVQLVPVRHQGDTSGLYSVDTLLPITNAPYGVEQNFTRMRWSPDGQRLLAGSYEGVVSIFELNPLREAVRIQEFDEPVSGVDWHPDGSRVAVSSDDRSVRVFDAATGARVNQFIGHRWRVPKVRYSSDGSRLASFADGGDVIVWNPTRRNAIQQFRFDGLGDSVKGVDLHWSEELGRFQCGGEDTFLQINERGGLSLGTVPVRSCGLVSASGRWAVDWRQDRGLSVRDPATGREASTWSHELRDYLAVLRWHPREPVLALALSDGVFLLTLSEDGLITERLLGKIGSQVSDLEWSDDGSMVLVTTTGPKVLAFEVSAGDVAFEISAPHPVTPTCATLSPGGSQVAVGDSDGVLTIYSRRDPTQRAALRGHVSRIENVSWSPDGARIATGGRDRTIGIWDPSNGQQVASFQTEELVSDVLWIAGGSMLVAVDLAGTIYSFDAGHSLGARDEPTSQ